MFFWPQQENLDVIGEDLPRNLRVVLVVADPLVHGLVFGVDPVGLSARAADLGGHAFQLAQRPGRPPCRVCYHLDGEVYRGVKNGEG